MNRPIKSSVAVDTDGAVTLRIGQGEARTLLSLLMLVGGSMERSLRCDTFVIARLLEQIGVEAFPLQGPDACARGLVEFRDVNYTASDPASGFMSDDLHNAFANCSGPMGEYFVDDMRKAVEQDTAAKQPNAGSAPPVDSCSCYICVRARVQARMTDVGTTPAIASTDGKDFENRDRI